MLTTIVLKSCYSSAFPFGIFTGQHICLAVLGTPIDVNEESRASGANCAFPCSWHRLRVARKTVDGNTFKIR